MIVTAAELRDLEVEALRLVEGAGAYQRVEALLRQSAQRPGRPRVLPVKALFVALQLLVFSGNYYLTNVPRVVNGLSRATKRSVGLDANTTITLRQVKYLVTRIDDVLRPGSALADATEEQRFAHFDEVFSAISTAGGHDDANQSFSVALDGTDIPAWARKSNIHHRLVDPETGSLEWGVVAKNTDTDAGLRGRDDKPALFGYELTVAVSVREDDGDEVPRATLAARLRPAHFDPRKAALACVRDIAHMRGLGDVLMDRGYTQSNHGEDFLNQIRRLGGDPVFDLKANQVGSRPGAHGAVIIDGAPYSPSLPKSLYHLEPPRGGVSGTYKPSPAALADYQDRIAARSVYALVPHGKARANGSRVFQCPGMAGKLLCPLVSGLSTPRTTAIAVTTAPRTRRPNSVCASSYRTFTLEELPLYQRNIYGSKRWFDSYGRRGGSIEPHFGGLKDESAESFRKGKVRVRGIVKTGLMLAFALASNNRRLANAWERRRRERATSSGKRWHGRPYNHRLTSMTLAEADKGKLLYPLRA